MMAVHGQSDFRWVDSAMATLRTMLEVLGSFYEERARAGNDAYPMPQRFLASLKSVTPRGAPKTTTISLRCQCRGA
jgi:hypothetical protein